MRVVTGTPVNLKERIAALQQRAASASPQSTSPFSASPSAQASLALPTGVASTSSVSALRERIARFEGKGGVPVPRGSFGLGAPQTRDGSVGRKRGELYGNRITSGGRDSPSSPPSSLSRLGVAGRDFNGDSQRSFSTNESGVGNGSSVRKRCISTSVLEGFTNGSPRSRAFPSDATSDTANESEGAEAESLSTELNAADSLHVSTRLTRRNSISSADALRSAIPKDRDSPPNETPEDAHSPPLRSLEPAVLQDVSEEGDVPETQTSILGLDVGESLPKNTLVESDDTLGIAAARQDTTDGVDEQQQELILEKVQEQQVLEDVADEDSAKTPVVSSFTASSIAMSHIYDEPATTDGQEIVIVSDDSALSDIATPNTGSLSPLTASLEIGERVFHETQKYVVVAPLGSAEAPVTIVLEGDVAPSSASTGNMGGVQSSSHLSEPEAKAETGETSEGRPEMPKIDIPLHSAPHVATSPSSATTTGSARRRHPPSPIPIIRDEHYVEPSLELKTGPKSFRAVVHGKKTQIPTVPLPRAMPSLLDAQVITVHQRAIGRVGPDSPGSPDLSALVAQALNLEQQLMGGESETLSTKSTSPDFASSNDSVTDSGMSQTSQVCFPRSPGVHKALSVSGDAVPPTPPPKSPHMNALVRDRESSRTSWSWSSEQASSEDSASVTTPPLSEGSEQVHDHTHPHIPAQGLSVEPPDEYEGRHSISSILSSPGRSARKKVLSMSRPTSVLGRMLSRSGRSSSTLALPGTCSPCFHVLPAEPGLDAPVTEDGVQVADYVPRSYY
ncbi:hypothetical protein M0805_005582 [Coniferiporia weirii]|nr:hypothetical protein M0805_005582 [Coniferiporia weirii]